MIVKWTGPPTAVRMNVPLAGLPLAAVSTSSFGAASRVPGVGGGGGGDGEGDGEGEGDGAGDGDRDGPGPGEDRTGAGDRDATSDVLEPGSVAAADVRVTGAGRRLGVDRPALAGSDAALDAAKSPPPSATVEASARCWPPAISSAAVPATTSAAATAATQAAARGRRRTSCHQRGPGAMIGFGKTRPAERNRAMCHAHPVGAPGRGPVRALLEHPLAQACGRTDLRHRAVRGRLHEPGLAQAFVPRDRVQPGAQLVRIAERLQLGGGDDKGVRHGVGGLGLGRGSGTP